MKSNLRKKESAMTPFLFDIITYINILNRYKILNLCTNTDSIPTNEF